MLKSHIKWKILSKKHSYNVLLKKLTLNYTSFRLLLQTKIYSNFSWLKQLN